MYTPLMTSRERSILHSTNINLTSAMHWARLGLLSLSIGDVSDSRSVWGGPSCTRTLPLPIRGQQHHPSPLVTAKMPPDTVTRLRGAHSPLWVGDEDIMTDKTKFGPHGAYIWVGRGSVKTNAYYQTTTRTMKRIRQARACVRAAGGPGFLLERGLCGSWRTG